MTRFPYHSLSAGVTNPSASSGCGSDPRINWGEIGWKYRHEIVTLAGTWLRRRLSLMGKVDVCPVYIFSLILYRLSILPLPKNRRLALQRSLSKLIWRGRSLMVCRQVRCQRPRNRGLGMPELENHWFAERLAYLGLSFSTDTV